MEGDTPSELDLPRTSPPQTSAAEDPQRARGELRDQLRIGRRLRDERGWSQKRLVQEIRATARLLGMNEPGVTDQMISRWENGHVGLSRENAHLVTQTFARTMIVTPDDDSWEHDMDRRTFLAGTASVGLLVVGNTLGLEPWQRLSSALQRRTSVDEATADNLETLTATFSKLFQTVAPVALAGPVRSHLETITTLLADASLTSGLRARLASLAGESSILLGWITQDQGDHRVAQQFYLSALDAADEAGDPALGAYAIASASTLPAFRSSPSQSLHLLTEAEVKGSRVTDATRSTRAWAYSLVAEAHVRDGNGTDAMQALDIAEDILDRSGLEDEPRPRAIFFDQARLVGERGVTATRLHLADQAEDPLVKAIDGLGHDPKTESRMLTHLARVRLSQDEPTEAIRLAIKSLEVALRTGSETGVDDIRTLRHDLNAWKGLDEIQELEEQLAVRLH